MKKKPKIKAIIFDLGGVVMSSGFIDLVRHYCAPCMSDEGQRAIKQLEHAFNLGQVTEPEFYERVQQIFDVHLSQRQMHDFIVSHMKADKKLLKLIPKLKKAKVAVLSNSLGHLTAEALRRRHIDTKKLFDQVFLSGKMHLAKPDRNAYGFVLRKLKVKPSEALMVDDRPENIKGAKRVGMHGIVYKNAEQFKRALEKYELVSK